MSKKIVRDRVSFSKNWTAVIAGSLIAATAQQAQAANENSFRSFREQNPDLDRAALRTMFREQRQELRGAHRAANISVPTVLNTQTLPSTENVSSRAVRNLERRLENNLTRNRSFQQLDGQLVRVERGINLDLTSQTRNIALGSNLFKEGGSVTINVGGKEKTVSGGDLVSAAEYVAVKQLLAGGGQKVVLDTQGRATGGDVDLSVLTQSNSTMRASDLVVPVNVTAIGDFNRGSDFRLLGDLDNSGTVHALTSGSRRNSGGALRADDILNQNGGVIKSDVENLLVDAAGNFTNLGTISANGNITLQAGGILTNSGSVSAKGDVGINANNVSNTGSITSIKGNVNFDGAATAALNIDSTGGTVSAQQGAINFRTEGYTGEFNNYVTGGDFLSKEFNTHAGQGTSYVDVGQLTGVVNQTGAAAHVQAGTDILNLGEICLTGDPTYRNTMGGINVSGDISVNEALTIIAEGDITVANNVTISTATTARGYDITLIAGADIIATSGGANLPSIPPGITGGVTINGNASPTGGSVLFGTNTTIAAQCTNNFGTGDGGNVNIYAFEGSSAGSGRVDIGGTTVLTHAGNAGVNGSVNIIAGASSGDAIIIGEIQTEGGSFSNGSSIYITSAQPTSNGGSVSWDANGQRTTAADIDASADFKAGNIIFAGGEVRANFDVVAETNGSISLTNTVISTNTGGGIVYLGAGGTITTTDTASEVHGQNVFLFAGGDIGSSTVPLNLQASTLNVTSVTGSAYLNSTLPGMTLGNGNQSVAGDFVLTADGIINVQSNINATNVSLTSGQFVPGNIVFSSAGHINATGNVTLVSSAAIVVDPNSTITGTELTLNYASGNTDMKTNVDGLTVINGAGLAVHNAKSLNIHDATLSVALAVDTTAAGTITVDGDITAPSVSLTNANGDIMLDGDITADSVALDTQGGTGSIDRTSGAISTLALSLATGSGGIGQTEAIEFTNDGASTTTLQVQQTGGTVGANLVFTGLGDLQLVNTSTIAGDFNLDAKDAGTLSLASGADVTAAGDLNLFNNNVNLNGGSLGSTNGDIAITGATNLVVDGGAGSTLTTGAGKSISFIAANGNLTTNGLLNFVGGNAVMTLQNNNGINSFTNSVGATLNGDTTNDLIITAQVYNANGTVQNFNSTIIVEGNTIANSNGDVNLGSNLIFNGQDLAIIASGNITGTLTEINLGSASGAGGNLTILAGVAFTPATIGQIQSADPFTITTASSSGGRIDLGSTNINTSSTVGNGGNVVMAAFAGIDPTQSTISVGNIDTEAASGFTSGSVRIIGPGAINTGAIKTGAASKNGVITVHAARPGLTGNIVVTNGVATGLNNLIAEADAGGSISVGNLNGLTANLNSSTGSIAVTTAGSGNLTNLNVTTDSGNFTSTGTVFSVSNATFTSNTGNFTVSGQNFQNLTSNVDSGTVTVTNNFVDLQVQGATGSAQDLIVSSGGVSLVRIEGAVNLGTGNLTVSSSGTGGSAIEVNAVVNANDISLTTNLSGGGIQLNEDINGTGTITLTSVASIEQLSGKVISGGNLVVDEATSSTAGLNLAVQSLQVDSGTDFKFTQNGDLELRALNATSVEGVVNTGNVTTGANISTGKFDLAVVAGGVTISHAINASTEAIITAATNIGTSAGGSITTPKLTLVSDSGNIGADGSLLAVNTSDLDITAETGNVFVSNANTGATELFTLETTGTVQIETLGALESTRPITGSTVTLQAESFQLIGPVTATTLIDITQTSGDISLSSFSGGLSGTALSLTATAGSVGTSATPLAIAAGFTTISGYGNEVHITSANTTGVTLGGGLASTGNFEFRTTGPLTVSGNVESTNGAILLENTAGLLQIGAGITILGDTAINIRNTGSVDEVDLIAIGANATIMTDTTSKTAGAGQINIVQGVAQTGKVRKNIKNVVQNLQGGGTILFGGSKASYIASAPTNTFNAIGANIYFSTDQKKNDGGLTIGGGVTITADPPVPAGSAITTYGAAPTALTVSSELSQPVDADTAKINNVALGNASVMTMNPNQASLANSLLNLASNDARMPGLVSDSNDNSYLVSYEPASIEVDAPVCTDLDIAITGGANGVGVKGISTMKHSECITMDNGNALFMPSKDTTVVTPKGTVKIAANAVAMVMVDGNQLSVYDINDHHKRSVTVETAGRTITLSPGRHVLLTNVKAGQFADVNPMEAMMHRAVSTQPLGGDRTAFTSEFSLPAAVQVMKPLKAIFASDNAAAKKVAERVIKTSAVIMHVSGGNAPFEHHVRPRRVALSAMN